MKINTNVMIGLDATMITFLTWIVLLVPAFSEVCPGQFDCEAFNRISCIDYIKVCDSNWDCYGKTDENYCYAPIVSVPATHSSVTTGNSVTVNCTVFSKLIVTDVYWQRTIGGVISLIKSTTNTNKYSGITANTPSLTIYNADTSDVGTYRCFAANVFGYGNSYPIELFLTEHANITITEFTTEGELVTGRNVTVICRAYVMHKKGPISVVWKMNNSVINPTHSSRWIPEIIQSNHPERWLFRLTVIKMKTSDSGILTCGVSDGLVNAEKTLIVNVIGKPTVDISPRTLTATLGDIVNINCTVVDSFSVNTSILWYKNGNIFNGNQDESVIRTDQAHTKLVVHGIQNSAQYACSGIDNYGEGDRITSHVTVINPDNVYQYCPINVDQFGGVWGITIENTIAIIPCPGDRTGTTSRLCNGNGDWEEPNYSACISLDLFILNLQSDFLKNGVEVKDSNSILLDLNNLTEPDIRENLTSGELEISSEILDNTAYYAKERTDSLSVDQLEIFVSSCDNLLKENTIPSWEQLKQLNFKGATRIAKAVTVYTKAYTNLNDSAFQRTVQKDQLVVQVGKVFNEDITFPKKTQELPYWITESTNQVTLSKDNFEGEKPVGYSTTYYRNISTLFHQYYLSEGVATKMNGIYDVNSVVIDFSIEPTPNRLQHPLVVKFEHLRVNYSNPVCAFWDFDALNTPNGAWSFSGSKLFKTSDGVTVCQYDHTSNFALLMSPGKATSSHSLVLSKISAAGCIISSIFLVVTVIVHALLWRHLTRDTHGRKLKRDKAMLLVNLCIALTISYVLFVVGITRTDNKKVCTSMAVLLHYIFLVDFACMLAVGIELAIYVLFVFSTSSRTKWLVPACWVFPAVIVGISVSATKLDGYGNSQYCWLSIESKLIWTFVGPALTVILINFIILMFVMKTTCVANPMQTKKDKTNIQRTKAGIRNLCVIVPLFGVTWVLGVFSVNDDTVVFQYLFAIFNSLQGFFIFVFHTVLDKHVREGIQNMREKKADKSSVYSQKDETKESYVHSTEFDDISKPTTHATGPVNSMANNEYSYQKKTERDNNKEARYSTNQKDILGSIKQYNTKKTKVQNKSRLDKDEQKIQKQEKGKD